MKRKELVKKLNKFISRYSTNVKFRASTIECCIEIYLDDPFVEFATLNMWDRFYGIIEKRITKFVGCGNINWNNTGTIFSIWHDSNTNALDD